MGILDLFTASRYERAIQAAQPGGTVDPSTYPIASPWSSSNLQRIVFDDIFGSDLPQNTRSGAMRIPSVARARNVMVSSIARNPLVAMRIDQRLEQQPSWLTASAGGMSPQMKMAWTVDDLIFYGWSCHWRENGSDKFPLTTERVNQGDWSVNADNRVEVNGEVVPDNRVILIPGMHEGILSYGYETLDDVRTLYENVRQRLENPIPGLDLHQTGGVQLEDEEIDALIERWSQKRRTLTGGVSYTSEHIEAKALSGGDDGQLMIESRNAASVDIARMIGVSASVIDATSPKASLNYETSTGRNAELVDRDLALYMDPIAWRLSMDDVTPHGTRIAFDLSAFTGPQLLPTGPATED